MPFRPHNAARAHREGRTPLTFAGGHTVARAELTNVRWVSHCRTWSSSQWRPDDEFETDTPASLNHVRWVSHCSDLGPAPCRGLTTNSSRTRESHGPRARTLPVYSDVRGRSAIGPSGALSVSLHGRTGLLTRRSRCHPDERHEHLRHRNAMMRSPTTISSSCPSSPQRKRSSRAAAREKWKCQAGGDQRMVSRIVTLRASEALFSVFGTCRRPH